MYNYDSPVIQSMRREGTLNPNSPFNIFSPDPPLENFMNPPQNPNMDYYYAMDQQLNIPTTPYCPSANTGYYFPQPQQPNTAYYQQQRQPWQLLTPNQNYQAQYANHTRVSPFVQNSYSYNGYQQPPQSYVIEGFNPTGSTEMYSPELRKRLNELNEKYQKLNTEKAIERRNAYGSYGYNYYGMMNQNCIDPMLMSQYNREKTSIEAEARELQMSFNLRLSRAVHNYLGDIDMNDQDNIDTVRKVYENKVVSINDEDYQSYQFQRSLDRGRDITEEAKASAIAADRKVSEYFHKIVSPNASYDEFLQNAGMILWHADVERMNKKGATFNERYSYDKLQKELQRNLEIRDGYYPSYRDLDPEAPFRELGLLNESPGVNFNNGVISLDRQSWEANKARIQQNRQEINYEQQRRAFINAVMNPSV